MISKAILIWWRETKVGWRSDRPRQADTERPRRKLQRQLPRRMPERDAVLVARQHHIETVRNQNGYGKIGRMRPDPKPKTTSEIWRKLGVQVRPDRNSLVPQCAIACLKMGYLNGARSPVNALKSFQHQPSMSPYTLPQYQRHVERDIPSKSEDPGKRSGRQQEQSVLREQCDQDPQDG
jgi:hypothetical protein